MTIAHALRAQPAAEPNDSCSSHNIMGSLQLQEAYVGLYRDNDNGKENGNYNNGLYRVYWDYIGLYRDNGKENGKYRDYIGFRV